RLPPYIYSGEEIAALMGEARRLRPAFRAVTAETVIGLLAVSGMFSGGPAVSERSSGDIWAAQTLIRELVCAQQV
ncbi:MAG: tyrosine-type recombinase/integrase, partial [Acidimicrobiales bacterium]